MALQLTLLDLSMRQTIAPVPNALRPEQYRIVQVHIRRCAIAKGLSGVEHERDVHTDFFLTLHETLQGIDIVYQGLQWILMSN